MNESIEPIVGKTRRGLSLSTLYMILLVLMPILNQYKILGMNFFDFFNVVNVGMFIFLSGKLKLNTKFFLYFIYTFILLIVFGLQLENVGMTILAKNIIVYVALFLNIYCIGKKWFEVEYTYTFYSKIVMLLTTINFFQILLYYLAGIRIPFILPIGTLNYGGEMRAYEYFMHLVNLPTGYRPSSLFLEPAMYAEYILPWLFITLFYRKDSNDNKVIIKTAIVSLFVCLSTSGLGLLGVFVAWLLYIEKMLFAKGKKKLLFILPALVVAGLYIYQLDSIQAQILSKMHSLQDVTRRTSLSLRLLRGWYCFLELPTINKILGTGYSLTSQFFEKYKIITVLDTDGEISTYMNGFYLMLCNCGIVGILLYIIPLTSVIKRNKKMIFLLICWALLQLIAQMFDSPTLLLLTLFIFGIAANNGFVHKEGYI